MGDEDNELDGKLLQQFSSMGTTDKEVLIAEFQKLLGDQLNAAGCAFFLDMNNWNLQAAICSYYDFEQPSIRLPSMSFVKDVTVGEGESVPPNTKFTKTWRLQNSGDDSWPPGCCLKFCYGDQMTHIDRVMSVSLSPGQVTDISIDMVSPSKTGIYQGQWRMITPSGCYFGEVIWVIINVDEAGLLAVTQQMSRFEFGRPSAQNPSNPFDVNSPKINHSDSSELTGAVDTIHSQGVNHYNNSDQVVLHPTSNQNLPLHSFITPESSPKSSNVEEENQEMMIS
ncbi:protein ILRUN [Octopus sinensis]|uniref:Protein ILRUN n=1 Tax=Octopus sinensis TaxID=2607531 RepID=A0A6P7SFE0_9MOLL|nr:protein ILRUN [Octopus sinensis]